jgi:hypothetical protein
VPAFGAALVPVLVWSEEVLGVLVAAPALVLVEPTVDPAELPMFWLGVAPEGFDWFWSDDGAVLEEVPGAPAMVLPDGFAEVPLKAAF